MDVADELLKKVFSWVKLQKQYGRKLQKLATELEETKKNCNVAKVVGSSVSVGGAAAMTVSAIAAVCTGGAAIPFLFTTGAISSTLGFTTNVVSDISDVVLSRKTPIKTDKEAKEIGENIVNLEEGIQKLMETLKKEGEKKEKRALSCGELSPEDYVTERILRSMAKREGLIINDSISLSSISSNCARIVVKEAGAHLPPLTSLVSIFAIIESLASLVRKYEKRLVSKGLSGLAASMGTKVAGKAVGRLGAGAVGLAFSVPELVINCINLDDCGTETSRSLRENAKEVLAASEQLQGELDEIQKLFQKIARVKSCIENRERSRDDRQTLFEFAKENCRDEAVQQWLIENEKSELFSRLVDMFQFLKAKIDEEKNNHSNTVDITFVAHGAITDPMIPASGLLPLPTLTDVVLYSPWNCYLSALAVFDIATGRLKPWHRKFYHSEGKDNKIHKLKKLPDEWNSMKKAKDKNQMIPNIVLSPLGPKDGAWKRFECLENAYGKAGRNRIIVPFILPKGCEEDIPLPVVTLALSLVLMFCRFQATLHLTACLGKKSEEIKLDEGALKRQYACTIDNIVMTYLIDWIDLKDRLYEACKSMFG